jgi:hypothetical protein
VFQVHPSHSTRAGVVKLYEIVNADFKERSDSCATDFPLITHATRGVGEEGTRYQKTCTATLRIKGGKSEREWSMVTWKGSGKVFGPK